MYWPRGRVRRRLEFHQRAGLLPRHARGFRRLAQHGQCRLGLGRCAAVLREDRSGASMRPGTPAARDRSTSRTSPLPASHARAIGWTRPPNSACREPMISTVRIRKASAATRSRFAMACGARRPMPSCGPRCAAAMSGSRPMPGSARFASSSGARVGVDYVRDGDARTSPAASREVIVCGGAVNSPQLLQLSGIGPARDPARGRHHPVARQSRRRRASAGSPGRGVFVQGHAADAERRTALHPGEAARRTALPACADAARWR